MDNVGPENVDSLDGKYEVLEKLHEGGMGAIYKVRHRLLDEVRVIKVMRPQHEANESLRARFLREAQMAVKLRHPHIAQMYDFALDESGRGFIVMEYVDGITLQQVLERVGAPSLGLSLELARQTLTALGFLHRKGIVHRDISPDNIMVARDDLGRPAVKLIDLGVAKVVTSTTGLTVSGTFLGKLLYASPEQFGGPGAKVDPRSDLYSLGVVLYEVFTGNHPFPGTSPQELIAGHLVKAPLDFAEGDPTGRVPTALREIVLRAIAKKPDDRFPTAEAMDQELAAVQARFPLDPEEFERVLQAPDVLPTVRIRIPAPGSTQEHIDAQFGLASTPEPISLADAKELIATAPAVPLADQGAPIGPHATQPTLVLPENVTRPAPPPAAPAAGDAGAAPATPAGPPPPKPAPSRPAQRRPPWALIGAGGAIALVVVALLAARAFRRPAVIAVAPPPPTAVAAAPQPAPTAVPVAQPTPPPAPPTRATVSQADFDKAIAAGNVDRLRGLLAGLSKEGRAAIAASQDGAQRLETARRSVEADAALGKALKGKEWEAVLGHAGALAALLPSARQAAKAREAAAAALEGEAEALLRGGRTDAALGKLEALQRAWPDRAGVDARLAALRAALETDRRLAAALAAADAAAKERRPEKGLAALAEVKPDARWQERFAAARQRLDALLAELDKAPPVVRLKPGSRTDFSKGKPFTVALVVTDDYRVKSVTVMARQEGAPAFQELPATGAADDVYSVEITPEFHGNKAVEVYVVAVDYAGHTARLGTAEQPLRFKKRWLF